tara:strand:- start:333 stop:875 length:543 start_codon:yes stop_codon:yes gene_type:complete
MAEFNPTKADLNKDGVLSDYEKNRGEAVAAAMPMLSTANSLKTLKTKGIKRIGNNMIFGSKQVNTPTAFSSYDYGVLMDSLPKVEYVDPAGEKSISMQEAGIVEVEPDKPKLMQKVNPVAITNKTKRVGGKIQRLERRKALQESKGRQRLDKGFTLGANQKRKRIANIEKRQERLRNRLK